MNKNGLFCAALLLAAVGIHLELQQARTQADSLCVEAKEIAMENEQINATRTAIEQNTDAIILQTLKEQAAAGKSPEEIKFAVNSKLLMLFAATEKNYSGSTKVKFCQGIWHDTAGNNCEGKEFPTHSFMQENSSAIVVPASTGVMLAEYSFTGGLLKNNVVVGEISEKNAKLAFMLPPGYTIRTVVLK